MGDVCRWFLSSLGRLWPDSSVFLLPEKRTHMKPTRTDVSFFFLIYLTYFFFVNIYRSKQTHRFHLLKQHRTTVDYHKVWLFFVSTNVFSFRRNFLVLFFICINDPFLYCCSSKTTQNNRENSERDTTVHTGVISLSTRPKTSGNFKKPVVITLMNNQVRLQHQIKETSPFPNLSHLFLW